MGEGQKVLKRIRSLLAKELVANECYNNAKL